MGCRKWFCTTVTGSPGARDVKPLSLCGLAILWKEKKVVGKFPGKASLPTASKISDICIYTVRQKKGSNFILCASFSILDRNW